MFYPFWDTLRQIGFEVVSRPVIDLPANFDAFGRLSDDRYVIKAMHEMHQHSKMIWNELRWGFIQKAAHVVLLMSAER